MISAPVSSSPILPTELKPSFAPTIPVVDMRDFENPATRQKFIDGLAKALHEVGFFAVTHTGVDMEALNDGYAAIQQFFSASTEQKDEINDPVLNGQRGYVHSEIAQGQNRKDHKEFLHIGDTNNLWPSWMDLQGPMERLLSSLKESQKQIEQAISLSIGKHEDYLSERTANGENLMRALHYPANPAPGTYWAAEHTDIDFFTILPMATEEGLQVLHDGEWIDVRVPPNAFIVNGGDMLENLTNGYFKSATHRVVAKANTERYSIVHFIHPRSEVKLDPLPHCVDLTGGVVQFPEATRWELLRHRLIELGLIKGKDTETEFMNRVQLLVDEKRAAPAVQKTHTLWQQVLQRP